MPRYRVIKPVPQTLHYGNGKVHFQEYMVAHEKWEWYVYREVIDRASVTICQAEDAILLDSIRRTGIETNPGSDADKVMRSLVRKGYAERLPDS